jgi:hypothetical protein
MGAAFQHFPTFNLNLLNCHGKLNNQPNPQVVLPFWDGYRKPYPVVGVFLGMPHSLQVFSIASSRNMDLSGLQVGLGTFQRRDSWDSKSRRSEKPETSKT